MLGLAAWFLVLNVLDLPDFSIHATVPLPFQDQVRSRFNHLCFSDAALIQQEQMHLIGRTSLETVALPIELLP